MPLPLTPLQILWINLITDGFPALALAVEPAEPGIMDRPPRKSNAGLIGTRGAISIILAGFLFGAVTLWSGYRYWAAHDEEWRTVIFAVLTFSQLGFALGCRSENTPAFRLSLFSNRTMLAAFGLSALLQIILTCSRLGYYGFGAQPLTLPTLALCLAASAVPLCAFELEKWLRPRC